MNTIKGLIAKDLLQLKGYRKTLIIYIIIFTLTGISQENSQGIGSMVSIMLILGFGMFSIATFSYDEQAKADRYILTLPLTRKELILSKYILVAGATIFGAILGTILSFVVVLIISKEIPDFLELISVALGGILGIGFVESIQIPCICKFGAEKGRMQFFIIIAMMALFLGGIFFVGEKVKINLLMDSVSNILSNLLPIIIILATVVLYYISYKITYRIYSKKEI